MSEDKTYKDGDIVWVKLGNNWWPGEVIDAHRHPDGLVTNIKRKLYCIVKFFNENAYEYVSNVKQIYPFQCPKKAEFLKKGLSLYKSGNKFMEKFPEDVEVAERLTRHQVPSVFINDRPDSIVKAILGQPLVLNCDDEYYGSSDYREKRKSSRPVQAFPVVCSLNTWNETYLHLKLRHIKSAFLCILGLNVNPHLSPMRYVVHTKESITKIINITSSKPAPPSQQIGAENVVSAGSMNLTNTAMNINFLSNSISSRTSFGGELANRNNTSTIATINNNNYHCNICDFTSVRQNVMILHRKMHSSRNGSTLMPNQNTSLNRSNTKVNIPAPATIAVKPSPAVMPPINTSTIASPLNTPAIDLDRSKTSDQSTVNSSSNDSSIIVVTDTSTLSDVEASPTDSQESQIRRSMRHTTKTATTSEAEVAHSGGINGSTVSIDLPETKPIKKIPKKRDFVNLNLLQDDEISSPIALDLQTNTTNTTESAASSIPATTVAVGDAEEIRKMLLEDWSDDDETPDNYNNAASESREIVGNNNKMGLLPLGPTLTSTPCSEYKSVNASTRIRNIPKKDRRDVILLDFSGEPPLNESVKEPEVPQRAVVPIEESSNSSAVELIEDNQPAVITINDEEEEVANIVKDSKNTKTSIITSRRSHFENAEPSDKSIVASILSCFDFQASDDEDDNDVIAAAGSRTPPTTHFKKKYLSTDKSQTYLKDGNTGKTTTTHQQKQNEEMAEKDQQLTAEIENLLAITQPHPTDLLTSTNSIEECLSVKDLPIKERGKRIFKSRNRSRIEEKLTNSISTDDSFTKDISPNILDIKQSSDLNKILVQRHACTGEAESIREISLGDTTKDSLDIRRHGDIEIVIPDGPAASGNKVVVNCSPDITNAERSDDLGTVKITCAEITNVTENELIATTKVTGGECQHVMPNESSAEVIVEIPQPLINNEFPTISNTEILTDVRESFTQIPTINDDVPESIKEVPTLHIIPKGREEKKEDIQLIETSCIKEKSTMEQEIVHLDVVQGQEDATCEVDIDKNSNPLTEESIKFTPSPETNPLSGDTKNLWTDTLISAIEKVVRVKQMSDETTNFCNTFDNVLQNVTTNEDHDDENNKNVEFKGSNEKITVAIDPVNEQLIMSAQEINVSNVTVPPPRQEIKSIKVDEDTILRQKQPDSSVTEEFTSNRLITTTPPTDENSSMGASDTGAEFGSPTSMLSEERLPTFLFSRNDTPQREVESTTENEVNKKINQKGDNVKESDQLLHNNIHAVDAVCESKNNLQNDMKGSNSSNEKVNPKLSTNRESMNDNDNSTSLSLTGNSKTLLMTDNPISIELKTTENNDLFSKHVRSKLSPDSAKPEQTVRKSPTGSHQGRNRHKRHITRTSENKVYIQSVESVELSSETATIATDANILNLSESPKVKEDQNESIKINLNQSVDSVKLQPKAVTAKITIFAEESVDNNNLKKPENNSINNKEFEKHTNQETRQKSVENESHVNENLESSIECVKDDQQIILEKRELICSSTQNESHLEVNPSNNKQSENTIYNVANKNTAFKNLNAGKKQFNDDTFNVDKLHANANKMDPDKTMIKNINSESSVPRSPKKRLGETILLLSPKHKRHDVCPQQTEILETYDQGKTDAVESNMNDNTTTESGTKLIPTELSDGNPHDSKCSNDLTEDTQTPESEISVSLTAVTTADTKLEITPTKREINSATTPKHQDLIIDCKRIVAVPSKPLTPGDKDVSIEIENHTMAGEEIIVEYESIPQANNILEYDPETGATMNNETINEADSILTSVSLPPSASTMAVKSAQPKCGENEALTNISQESYAADKSTEDFLIEFDSLVNQSTETKTEHEEHLSADDVINNLKDQGPREKLTDTTSKIPDATNLRHVTESQRDQSSLFSQRVAIKRRKTICFELAEFGLRIGESTRKRQVIDFEDTMPEGSTTNRRTNERKMTMPATFDYNSQFKSFKPRRRSSIEDNMKNFSRNWAHIDEELIEANSNVSSKLAAKQIGIDSKGNKYVVIKDVASQPQGPESISSIRKQRSDSSDSSLITQRNCRTMKRKSSQSKGPTSKSNTKTSAAILSRRLSLPSENPFRIFGTSVGCVAIKPKITRDQVISSLNDNQLSTAQQQLMQLQQQQQQQQQIQSSSIMLNKQLSSRARKTHRTHQQSSNQIVQQGQLQQQHNIIQPQPQLQQQLITQLSNQQNILQFVTPQVQQQVQPVNEGFIIATAATTEDDNVIDSNTQLIALPTQPYPGYTETFLLCKVNGNTCKPVDNVPLYLNHQLNELVPIPLDVLESTPQMATNNDGTVEIKQGNTQQLVVEDKTTEHITIGEAVLTDVEVSSQENVIHEQYLHDNVEAAVNEEEVTADLSSNNGILLNIEGQQVLLDAATFEHLLANPDANTQLISDDGTEYVLTHEVLQALHMQQQQEQQQQQIISITNANGSNNDIIAVAMAGSDLYGNGVLTIDTSQAMQLLDGNGSVVFQQPTTPMVQQHLTPPAIVTNAVLDQSPIMSTLEVPSGSRMQIPHCITVPSIPIVAPSSVILGSGESHPNLDDSLAAIGVTAQTSAASSVLGLPITVTDPNIASKVTSAGPLNEMLQFVSHRPATAAATAAAVAAAALAGESRIFTD